MPPAPPPRRARHRLPARLVRAYPSRWRRRWGDELVDLLQTMADDGTLGARVSADVILAGAGERVVEAMEMPLAYVALVLAAVMCVSVWSQLSTATTTAAARGRALPGPSEVVALIARGLGPAVGLLLAALSIRVGVSVWRAWRARWLRRVVAPLGGVVLVAGVLTFAGWASDRSRWYTPAGAALPAHGAPHLATLWLRGAVATVTPAWIHPEMFWRMPAGEVLAALAAGPAVVLGAVALAQVIRRAPATTGDRRVDRALGFGVVALLASFTSVAVIWVSVSWSAPGRSRAVWPNNVMAPGHTGAAVVAVLAMLTAIAGWSMQQSRHLRGSPALRG